MKKIFLVIAGLLAILAVSIAAGVAVAAPAAEIPAPVAAAVEGAVPAELGARLEILAWKQSRPECIATAASVERAITGSGRYAVKLTGQAGKSACDAWGWVQLRLFAPAFITTRAVRAGEPLEGAVKESEKEVRAGRAPAQVGAGAKAGRHLGAGQLVEATHLDAGAPGTGESIKVVVQAGALSVSQNGRAVPCGRGRVCAVLPSGKHVEGRLEAGVLVVEAR